MTGVAKQKAANDAENAAIARFNALRALAPLVAEAVANADAVARLDAALGAR